MLSAEHGDIDGLGIAPVGADDVEGLVARQSKRHRGVDGGLDGCDVDTVPSEIGQEKRSGSIH